MEDMRKEENVTGTELAVLNHTAEENNSITELEIGMYVKFAKPYVFEEDTYEGIDMSCLENLSAADLGEIEKRYYKLGIMSFNPENTASYAKIVVQKASGLPIEFFDQLPLKEMLKIRSRVVNFFYN